MKQGNGNLHRIDSTARNLAMIASQSWVGWSENLCFRVLWARASYYQVPSSHVRLKKKKPATKNSRSLNTRKIQRHRRKGHERWDEVELYSASASGGIYPVSLGNLLSCQSLSVKWAWYSLMESRVRIKWDHTRQSSCSSWHLIWAIAFSYHHSLDYFLIIDSMPFY